MDNFVHGIFAGALVICLLMLNYEKPRQCVVEMGRGNITNVLIGDYHAD